MSPVTLRRILMELHNFTKFGIKNWSMVVIFCISTKSAILRDICALWEFKTRSSSCSHSIVGFEIKVCFEYSKVMREEFNGFFIVKKKYRSLDCALLYCKMFWKRLEHSRSKEKHSTTCRVSPYTAAYTSCYPGYTYGNRTEHSQQFLIC